jgi:mRNA-degrading endonuclease toxin of MazEF toxin-antitoxin module
VVRSRLGIPAGVGEREPRMTAGTPKPGEIYFADIGAPTERRVIILSREELNRGKYVLAVPVTKQKFEARSKLPNCVPFRAGQYSFTANCVAQGERVAFLQRAFLNVEVGPLARLAPEHMRLVIRAVGHAMDADCEPGAL